MMKQNYVFALFASFGLAGCSTSMLAPVQEKVNAFSVEADAANKALQTGQPVAKIQQKNVTRVDGVWLPVTKVEQAHSALANAALSREIAVNRKFNSVSEVASYVTQLIGAPTTVSPALALAQSTNPEQPAATAPPGFPGAQPMPMPGSTTAAPALDQKNPPLIYKGKVSGFLDLAASRFGGHWEWDGKGIYFYKTRSKTFRLAALPGDTSLTSRIGSQSSTSTGGSGSSTSGASSSELRAGVEFSGMSVWKGIEDSIRTMMSTDGKLTVTPATGTITVDDTPMVLQKVEKFVEQQNIALGRQVVLNVRVLSVELSHSDAYGINWNMVYRNISDRIGVTASAAGNPIAGAGSLAFRILSGSMWDGSSLIVEALSKQGKVSQVTSASMVTINNQPAPIQVGRQTAYLASSTTTLATDGGAPTVTLQPGQINTGFSMNMLPHILDGNRLMLQYSGDISTLTRLNTVTSGTSSIQTPEVDTRNFMQRTIMTSGETIVVTGFEQFNLNGESSGIGNAENVAFGGSVNTKNARNVLVVLIQPVLLGSKS